jgi:hypothetical protein
MRRAFAIVVAWLVLLSAGSALANGQDTPSQKPVAPTKSAPSAPSASDIAAARTSHKVWVNLDTGIYHKGGRWYGKTKNGKFMTPDDAKKAGYKPAKRD